MVRQYRLLGRRHSARYIGPTCIVIGPSKIENIAITYLLGVIVRKESPVDLPLDSDFGRYYWPIRERNKSVQRFVQIRELANRPIAFGKKKSLRPFLMNTNTSPVFQSLGEYPESKHVLYRSISISRLQLLVCFWPVSPPESFLDFILAIANSTSYYNT